MKKQISLALITLSLFSLNTLPAFASNGVRNDSNVIGSGYWCVQIPWMGFFCWDL